MSGAIPPEIGTLARLKGLGLANNHLTGPLPPELADLGALIALNLAGNDGLAGPIPRNLVGLDSLRWLRWPDRGPCLPGTTPFVRWLDGVDHNVVFCNAADVEVLRTLRATTDGVNWTHQWPQDNGADLGSWVGVTADSLGRVTRLDLTRNGLKGRLPATLGGLTHLVRLRISHNDLRGRLPMALTALDLQEFEYAGTDLCTPADRRFQAWLATIPGREGTGQTCGPLSDREALEALYEATNGWDWWRNDNWLTLAPLEDWDGISVDDQGRVTELQISGLGGALPGELGDLSALRRLSLHNCCGSSLTGPIPPEIGKLEALAELRLTDFDLTGSIPPELANLKNLNVLDLSGNARLAGPLPTEFTALSRLDELVTDDTELCAPPTIDFATWVEGIGRSRIPRCDPPQAYLTQVVQSAEFPVPLVAGRKALLRVFVTASRSNDRPIPTVRAQFYVRGRLVHIANIPGKPGPIPTVLAPQFLSWTVNAEIPASVVRPGLEMVVHVDPNRVLDPELGVPTRIPETGRLTIDVQSVPRLDLTLIPFVRRGANPDLAIVDLVREVADDPANHELLGVTRTMLPIGDLRVTAHDPVQTSSTNPYHLLAETGAIRAIEGGTGHYMGMMENPARVFDWRREEYVELGGLSWISGPVSFSQPHPVNIAHELGHNFSLWHASCGSAPNRDPAFPARRWAWGYDFRNGTVVNPSTPDLMSYCDPVWISGYHFSKALRFRRATNMSQASRSAIATRNSLLLWGGVDGGGVGHLNPAFLVDAVPVLPEAGTAWKLTGRTVAGTVFSLAFDMPELPDHSGGSVFAFTIPVTWTGELDVIELAGPHGVSAILDHTTNDPMTIVRDHASGRVVGILRRPTEAAASRHGREDPIALFSRGVPRR